MQFHGFRPRNQLVFSDEISRPQGAVRVKCIPLLLSNKCCDTDLPYTITVLPSFQIPYARLLANRILGAISFILSGGKNKDQVLNLLGSDNQGSIYRHLKRAAARLNKWLQWLMKIVSDMHRTMPFPTLPETFTGKDKKQRQWEHFLKLAEIYLDTMEKIPGTPVIPDERRLEFIHTRLTHAGFGLGP